MLLIACCLLATFFTRSQDEVHRMSSHLPSLRSGSALFTSSLWFMTLCCSWQATKDTIGGAVDRAAEGLGLHVSLHRLTLILFVKFELSQTVDG